MKTKTVQARKQRKRLASSSLHQKHKLLTAILDKVLREKFKRRNLPVKKGDHVRVLNGKFKGVEGIIVSIDLDSMRVFVDKVVSKKRDGTEVPKPIHASNLMLIEIDLRDKARQKVLERKVSKTIVEAEAKKGEERAKKEEAARKAKEEAAKKKEEEAKAEKEKKEDVAGEEEAPIKVSEKGIDDKTKKDWITEK